MKKKEFFTVLWKENSFMMEIVFSDSAAGSLKCAQLFGHGKYHNGPSAFCLIYSDGRMATEEELEQARQEYVEKERRAWERAVPLGGTAADVFGFNLALSVGEIAEEEVGERRRQALELLFGTFHEGAECVQLFMKNATNNLKRIKERMAAGEAIRIWYSNNPDEMCGIYWFMYWLNKNMPNEQEVILVKLPEWEEGENGEIIQRQSFGEVDAENWHQYLPLQKKATQVLRKMFAIRWQELKKENAKIRACLNGKLVSVSEDIYDCFILRELEAADVEFAESRVIGKVLGNYQLGISDSWIHLRINEMIEKGKLKVVSEAEEGMPAYARKLRKLTVL